jgi:hypothetical protein
MLEHHHRAYGDANTEPVVPVVALVATDHGGAVVLPAARPDLEYILEKSFRVERGLESGKLKRLNQIV